MPPCCSPHHVAMASTWLRSSADPRAGFTGSGEVTRDGVGALLRGPVVRWRSSRAPHVPRVVRILRHRGREGDRRPSCTARRRRTLRHRRWRPSVTGRRWRAAAPERARRAGIGEQFHGGRPGAGSRDGRRSHSSPCRIWPRHTTPGTAAARVVDQVSIGVDPHPQAGRMRDATPSPTEKPRAASFAATDDPHAVLVATTTASPNRRSVRSLRSQRVPRRSCAARRRRPAARRPVIRCRSRLRWRRRSWAASGGAGHPTAVGPRAGIGAGLPSSASASEAVRAQPVDHLAPIRAKLFARVRSAANASRSCSRDTSRVAHRGWAVP